MTVGVLIGGLRSMMKGASGMFAFLLCAAVGSSIKSLTVYSGETQNRWMRARVIAQVCLFMLDLRGSSLRDLAC